jgi:hypothetical protein
VPRSLTALSLEGLRRRIVVVVMNGKRANMPVVVAVRGPGGVLHFLSLRVTGINRAGNESAH